MLRRAVTVCPGAGSSARIPWLVVGAALTLGGGCHLAIDGELGTVHCTDEGSFGPPACPVGQTCIAGVCAAHGAPLGHPCSADADCASPAICLDPAALGDDAEASFCSRPCCSSADCGSIELAQVCHSSGDGAVRMCWPAGRLGRNAIGERAAGQACGPDRACRSGSCLDGRCADVCCDDRFCSHGGQRCVAQPPVSAAGLGWACDVPSSTANDPPTCERDDECATGRCLPLDPQTSVCATPCCSSLACGQTMIDGSPAMLACVTAPDENLRACARVARGSATGAVGAPCSSDDECRSGVCIPNPRGSYCSDACCRDPDCGDVDAFACLPTFGSAGWSLQCVRK